MSRVFFSSKTHHFFCTRGAVAEICDIASQVGPLSRLVCSSRQSSGVSTSMQGGPPPGPGVPPPGPAQPQGFSRPTQLPPPPVSLPRPQTLAGLRPPPPGGPPRAAPGAAGPSQLPVQDPEAVLEEKVSRRGSSVLQWATFSMLPLCSCKGSTDSVSDVCSPASGHS